MNIDLYLLDTFGQKAKNDQYHFSFHLAMTDFEPAL